MISNCLVKMGIIELRDGWPNIPRRIFALDRVITNIALGILNLCAGLLLVPCAYATLGLSHTLVKSATDRLNYFSFYMGLVCVDTLSIIVPFKSIAGDIKAIGSSYTSQIDLEIARIPSSRSISERQIKARLLHITKTAASVVLCVFRLLFGLFNFIRSVQAKNNNPRFIGYAETNISVGFEVIKEVALFGLKMINPTCCT